jgi:hypothetical protein
MSTLGVILGAETDERLFMTASNLIGGTKINAGVFVRLSGGRRGAQKDRPKAVSVCAITIGSGREHRDALATAICHCTDTSEAQDHHGPGRRFGNGADRPKQTI